jgi:type I restriction enzyme M protein
MTNFEGELDPIAEGIENPATASNYQTATVSKVSRKSSEIWGVADVLRGTFKPAEYIRAVLPFIVLRRFDSVLIQQGTHAAVTAAYEAAKDDYSAEKLDTFLKGKAGLNYYNTGNLTLEGLLSDPDNLKNNLLAYINSYSPSVVSIMNNFSFKETIEKLEKFGLLFGVVERFANMDLSLYSEKNPNGLTNIEMGYVFEDLLRRFSEMTNETAGEHYTPRSIVQLCAELAIGLDDELDGTEVFKSVYDPTAGTGGMLTVGEETIKHRYPNLDVKLYGQELNPESFAIAQADLLIKGHDSEGITLGNTLTEDKHNGKKFSYVLANPPYGVSWKHEEKYVKEESEKLGFNGRFGAGTPSVSDGSLLFVQHMISKLDEKGRCAVVLNGSPLTNGDAGSGESSIRKWILDNDLLVAIIALPTDMFYNTGIKTYIWVLDRTKEERRKGKVQFVDASGQFFKMKKALGSKRNDMSQEQVDWVKKQYEAFDKANSEFSKVVTNEDLMFRKVTVDVAEVDANGNTVKDKKGNPVVDKSQRDTEKVPFTEDIAEYMKREVLPHVPNAIWDEGKVGAEFPLDQYFYKYEPLPTTEEVKESLDKSVASIQSMMKEIFE